MAAHVARIDSFVVAFHVAPPTPTPTHLLNSVLLLAHHGMPADPSYLHAYTIHYSLVLKACRHA